MALKPLDAACPHCANRFRGAPQRSFLGFQKLECSKCGRDVIYPLTDGYRFTYWILFAFTVLSMIAVYSQGGIGYPGGFGIAISVALIRDWQIRSRVAMDWQRIPEQSAARPTLAESAIAGVAESKMPRSTEPRQARNSGMALVNEPTEEWWADALAEVEGATRRPGLWAKCFAAAAGNEATAKANYLLQRANELQAEHGARVAAAEAASAEATEREKADLARQIALREAHKVVEAKAKSSEASGGC